MANPTAIPRTYRRGFRRKVSVIRCYPTTFASLDQESFRIIDNTPIYGDFGPNRSPRCTFGNFVQGLGVDTSEEQVIFPIGLTQKVAELLRACGRWPAIRPNQKVEYATKHLTPDSPGFMCPAPLRRTYGRLYSLLQLPHQDDRFRVIAGL